ncbi:hypothetical protein OG21DRAFT_1491811 [Imleria badia]|nr:hypothetical protein OG21DRAFT_1491811 [Imleria badia]
MVHRSEKTNPADPLSRRSDYEEGVENDNTQQVLLPDTLFTDDKDVETAVRSVETVETKVVKLQHKREKYAIKGLSKENTQWKETNNILYYKDLLYIPKDDKLQEQDILELGEPKI